MRRARRLIFLLLLAACACRPVGADVVTPTPVLAATSYVAPLNTVAPTAQQTVVPTPVPEEITPPSEIITVEPATEASATATDQP